VYKGDGWKVSNRGSPGMFHLYQQALMDCERYTNILPSAIGHNILALPTSYFTLPFATRIYLRIHQDNYIGKEK